MTQETESVETRPAPPPLKVLEAPIDAKNPWGDDVLDREEVADRLTTIVRDQEAPFVISVDGRWGTGKTFLLKRWQQELENQGWQAIYYNAWEDDFSDDPLLAIIAQFSQHAGTGFKERAGKLVEVAGPLLSYGVSLAALLGAGIPVPPVPIGKASPTEKLNAYLEKRAAKDELRALLRELAAEVRVKTNQPLVFIIDELDRCRPTFAIELLERVKHIFDVPNIVFVFGINREELVNALQSVYGKIDAGTYLRRFFDMEFILPEADASKFCEHLVQRFRLASLFEHLSKEQGTKTHSQQFDTIATSLPLVLGGMGLSLRDMDYSVRLLALAGRDLPKGQSLYAEVFALLVAVKIVDPALYRRFVQGTARGAEVVDFLYDRRTTGDSGSTSSEEWYALHSVEAAVYAADDAEVALAQMKLVKEGKGLTKPQYIAAETAELNPDDEADARRLDSLMKLLAQYGSWRGGYGSSLNFLPQRVDLYFRMTRLPGT